MAADKEAVGSSRVHNVCTQSADNLLHSFTVLWENEYCVTSNLCSPFTSVKSCPLVLLPVLILKYILSLIRAYIFGTIQYLKTSI